MNEGLEKCGACKKEVNDLNSYTFTGVPNRVFCSLKCGQWYLSNVIEKLIKLKKNEDVLVKLK